MITESDIYWLTRLDSVHKFSEALLAISVCGLIFSSIILILFSCDAMFSKAETINARRVVFIFALFALLFGSVFAFVPTSKEYASMKIIPIVSSEDFVKSKVTPELEAFVKKFNRWCRESKNE